jgi:hypothetical protein
MHVPFIFVWPWIITVTSKPNLGPDFWQAAELPLLLLIRSAPVTGQMQTTAADEPPWPTGSVAVRRVNQTVDRQLSVTKDLFTVFQGGCCAHYGTSRCANRRKLCREQLAQAIS